MYQLINGSQSILRDDGAVIPPDPSNRDYSLYQAWLDEGNIPNPPAVSAAAQALAALQSSAHDLLDDSDLTVLRCVENSVAVPASWTAYRKSLRAIANGSDTSSTALPAKPNYPAGT